MSEGIFGHRKLQFTTSIPPLKTHPSTRLRVVVSSRRFHSFISSQTFSRVQRIQSCPTHRGERIRKQTCVRVRKPFSQTRSKIGFHCALAKISRTMQTAQNIPVRYGPPTTTYLTYTTETTDDLPKDPRQWTREHVADWLRLVTSEHGLPEVAESRFLMNGKALCLMTPRMFLARVPLGGKLLYKDFQLRLCAAMYAVE